MIALTAHREQSRIKRLEEVARRRPPNVLALHNHKGTLSVNWATMPTIANLTLSFRRGVIKTKIPSTIT